MLNKAVIMGTAQLVQGSVANIECGKAQSILNLDIIRKEMQNLT
jgi:hypothetical protein